MRRKSQTCLGNAGNPSRSTTRWQGRKTPPNTFTRNTERTYSSNVRQEAANQPDDAGWRPRDLARRNEHDELAEPESNELSSSERYGTECAGQGARCDFCNAQWPN